MIILGEYLMVNPAHVACVENERIGDNARKVVLYGASSTRLAYKTGTNTECELLMNYICEEIDKYNGRYKENNNEENIN